VTRDPQGSILYDASCGICRRWVSSWTPTLRRYGFTVAPLQDPWVASRTGLTDGELLDDVRLLHPDGRLTSGPDVYRYVLRRIWWAYPGYLLSLTPGVRRLFDWAYRTFARHRGAFSASCGLASPSDVSWSESASSRRSHG
jgi:predicted DCC family thiol-disulfide oxidoreductase YuxK